MPDRTDVSAKNKIKACILGGAIGDALGFPIEGVVDFATLDQKFGSTGIQKFIPPISPFEDQKHLKAGDTTDDTAMLIATCAAIVKTHEKSPNAHMISGNDLLYSLWQAYMAWAKKQSGGKSIAAFTDKTINWPKWFSICEQKTGISRSTLAALSEGRMGTLQSPMLPNKGNGAMMRIAPLGFLPLSEDHMADLAIQSAAITHGSDEAQAAAAAIALTIQSVFNGTPLTQSLQHSMNVLGNLDIQGHIKCKHAFTIAARNLKQPISCKIADSVPTQMGYRRNKFMAIPVLGQVAYGVMIAEKMENESGDKKKAFRSALSTVATTSGDSDTAASILGNILGTAWGTECLPSGLIKGLRHKAHLVSAANSLYQTIHHLNLEQRV